MITYDDNGQVQQLQDLDLVLLNWADPEEGIQGWVGGFIDDSTDDIDQADLDGVLLHWGNWLVLTNVIGL